ncbi:MAG: DSD1 family PLP-dependent enzyme [Holophaga sp.]|jgi:D-serine deaminase-like pyridoxal phosphate-dependent protein
MVIRPLAEIGMPLSEVDTPALLVDLDAFEGNLRRLADAAAAYPVRLRPHAKTHKCPLIALRQIAAGAVGVCCQKVAEAEAMVQGGVRNVLVSNEIVGAGKLLRLAALAQEAWIGVCVDDAANVEQISEAAASLGVTLSVLVEVNVGGNRCGVHPGEAVLQLAQLIAGSPGLRFAGLQAYQGKAQHVREYAKRKEAIDKAVEMLQMTTRLLEKHGLACELISGAGTGTYPFEAASGVFNEVQPGSYIFMDADYGRDLDRNGKPVADFAHSLFVLATVMSHPVKERAALDAGHKALSMDSGYPLVVGKPGVEYVNASDEQGMLSLQGPGCALEIGEKVRLIPGHCDPTVNLHDWFVGYRGERVEALWPIAARGAGF